MPEGAVVIRSADPELQLQGLRTALSLTLGDRPIGVYLAGEGRSVLAAADDSEAGRCLVTLREARVPFLVEAAAGASAGDAELIATAELLAQAGMASFQQTF